MDSSLQAIRRLVVLASGREVSPIGCGFHGPIVSADANSASDEGAHSLQSGKPQRVIASKRFDSQPDPQQRVSAPWVMVALVKCKFSFSLWPFGRNFGMLLSPGLGKHLCAEGPALSTLW